MYRLYLMLILLLHTLSSLQAQELQEKVKLFQKDSLTPGTYLFRPENPRQNPDSEAIKVRKRTSEGGLVVELQHRLPSSDLPPGEFYKIASDWKLSPGLSAIKPGLDLQVSVHTTNGDLFQKEQAYEVLSRSGNFFVLRIPSEELQELARESLVTHINEQAPVGEEAPVTAYDLSPNRLNLAHHNFPGIKGENLVVSIKEQLFDTSDVDLRGRIRLTGLEDDELDQHANLMATLISGGGNSGSRSKGVAPAAYVSSSSFRNIFPAPEAYYLEHLIFVENHSYGGTPSVEYGNEAAAYDQLVHALPQLLHVFSSGNSGMESSDAGPYAGIEGYANLTGNYKAAKNVLTVGAVDGEQELILRSSKGPTSDGRIKPELVAYAVAGTSDAAAMVSGTSLLLQDLYLQKEGHYPSSALLKALLIAGARDVGAENPDFATGYGNLDANRSLEILEKGNYVNAAVAPYSAKEFELQIPAGTAELKLALTWIDPAANPGDERSLINDLNLLLEDPQGNLWHPWVLHHSPSLEALESPARRGVDSLNNVEVLSLKNPLAGSYKIRVAAENLTGLQEFSLAYGSTRENDFRWTYPTSSDPLSSGEINTVRWETSHSSPHGSLEYRLGEGEWQTLPEAVDLASEAFKISLGAYSGTAQLRMKIGSQTYPSDVFALSPVLTPAVQYDCSGEVAVAWEKVSGATSYLFRHLGARYMEPLKITADTSVVISKELLESSYISLTPVFGEIEGKQGTGLDYTEQGVNCYYRNFYALLSEEPRVTAVLNLSTLQGVAEVRILKQHGESKIPVEVLRAPFSSFSFSIEDTQVLDGLSRYYAEIVLDDGKVISTGGQDIYLPGRMAFTVYPNPVEAGEELSIDSRGDELEFEVYDLQGRKVQVDQLLRFRDRVEMSLSAKGLYLVRATRDGKPVGVAKILVR